MFFSMPISELRPLAAVPTISSINIGTLSIPTYPLMIGIGAIAMLVCIWNRRKRFSLLWWQCILFTFLLTVCGIAGAKLLFILENIREVLESGSSTGGVSFFGSVYLVPLIMPLVGWLFRLKPSQTHDLCAPCIAIMVAFIRIGCLFNGCCGGRVVYTGNYYFSWPTQIMECIGDVLIFLWLLDIEEKGGKEGFLYPLLMLSYSIMRFFIEFLRYSSSKWLYLSNGHWFALAAIVAAVLWLRVHKRNCAQRKGPKIR